MTLSEFHCYNLISSVPLWNPLYMGMTVDDKTAPSLDEDRPLCNQKRT